MRKLIVFGTLIFASLLVGTASGQSLNDQLIQAVQSGDSAKVQTLIADGADVNASRTSGIEFGWTPLMNAVVSKNQSIAELLIAKGANVNAAATGSDSPFIYEVLIGNKSMVELMLANGADVNRKGSTCTPLNCAEYRMEFHLENKQEIVAMLQAAIAKNVGREAGNDLPKLLSQFTGHSDNDTLRDAIIDVALEQHPAIPPEAEAAAGRGTYIFKNAASPDDVLSAAKQYLSAIEAAPWVADYYFNLCTVLEKTPYTAQALHACKLYLVAAPDATDAASVRQRIAGLQYAADRDKAQMKQRTLYIKGLETHDLYSLGSVSGTVSGKEIAMKLSVDWTASPPKYQVYVGCLQGSDAYGVPHDLVSTDSWTGFCNPELNMHLIIQPEGEGFVAVSDSSGSSLRTTFDDLFKAKQQTMAQAVMFSTSGAQGDRFYVTYAQGGLDQRHTGFVFYESDCNGNMLKKDPRALPDDFVPQETVRATKSYGIFSPEINDYGVPKTDLCTTQFANKTGYHFGEAE